MGKLNTEASAKPEFVTTKKAGRKGSLKKPVSMDKGQIHLVNAPPKRTVGNGSESRPLRNRSVETRFRPGNQLWKVRSTHGRKPLFSTPEKLFAACREYMEWVDQNPLKEAKLLRCRGRAAVVYLSRMRPMTIDGLCLFLGISQGTWRNYRKRKHAGFLRVCKCVESIIWDQKFGGAAAGFFKYAIIAHELSKKQRQRARERAGPHHTRSDERAREARVALLKITDEGE
ncbi:MAG: DNA-packaging protein [Proteobacteria bacterium]|nr:DNA-packaging protein [Pseudomonadota bacterium]